MQTHDLISEIVASTEPTANHSACICINLARLHVYTQSAGVYLHYMRCIQAVVEELMCLIWQKAAVKPIKYLYFNRA